MDKFPDYSVSSIIPVETIPKLLLEAGISVPECGYQTLTKIRGLY